MLPPLAVAGRFAMQTLRQQTVVMVTGPAGAGKSTIAVVLARALPAVLIDNDVTPGTIDPLLAGEARREARAAAYDALTDAALDAARSGAHVVVAAPLSEERRDARAWDHLCDRFADAGAQAVLAWIRVPAGDLLERLAARSADRDEVKLANPGGVAARGGSRHAAGRRAHRDRRQAPCGGSGRRAARGPVRWPSRDRARSLLVLGANLGIDRTLRLERLLPGYVQRPREARATAGGKAVNICRAARAHGIRPRLVANLPGRMGELVGDMLDAEGHDVRRVVTAGEARSQIIVIEDDQRITVLNEPGPELSPPDFAALLAAAAEELAGRRVAVASGSLPPGAPDDAYGRFVEIARAAGAVSVVDAARAALRGCLAFGPDVVTPNLAEASAALLGTTDEAVEAEGDDVRALALDAARALRAGGRARGARHGRTPWRCRRDRPRLFLDRRSERRRCQSGRRGRFVRGRPGHRTGARRLRCPKRRSPPWRRAARPSPIRSPAASIPCWSQSFGPLSRWSLHEQAEPSHPGRRGGARGREPEDRLARAERRVCGVAGTSTRGVLTAGARELGFRPNLLARSLASGRTSAAVGLIISDVARPLLRPTDRQRRAGGSARARPAARGRQPPRRPRAPAGARWPALVDRRVDALLVVPAPGNASYLRRATSSTGSWWWRSTGRWSGWRSTRSSSTTAAARRTPCAS